MKILKIIKCIIFICIYYSSSDFIALSLKCSRSNVGSNYLFLNTNNLNFCRKLLNNNSVYNNIKDSFVKYSSSPTNYSNYLEENRVSDVTNNQSKILNILAIETSFDDTCIAVVRSDGKILSEAKSSQKHIIEKYGGLKPYLSQEAHKETIESMCDEVIKDSGLQIQDIDEIAVTRGPGMELCLRVGYNFAMDLSKKYNIPLVSENHIAAHCLSPMITNHQYKHLGFGKQVLSTDLKYPYLALLISGGHSQIYLVENPSTFYLMCDTVDQFAGSVLDKCARDLGLDLGNGGGAELEKAASGVKRSRFEFTLPSKDSNYLHFCFSGIQSQLKKSIKVTLKEHNLSNVKQLPKDIISELAFTAQTTIFDKIIYVLYRVIDISRTFFPIRQIAVVGGVAANTALKNKIFDLLYETDDSILFDRQRSFVRKIYFIINKYFKYGIYALSDDNPYLKLFNNFMKQVKSLEDFIHYLWNPDLFPDLLMPGRLDRVSTKHNNELYKGIIYLYFSLIGPRQVYRIKRSILKTIKTFTLLEPSLYILNMIKNDKRTPCPKMKLETQVNKIWNLYSTSKKYSTDNAVMIAFSLIEKHKAGFTGVKSQDKINGKDVLPRWNLGDRKNWEILSDICKIDSLIRR